MVSWAPQTDWMYSPEIMQPCNELNTTMHYRGLEDIPEHEWSPRTSTQPSIPGMTAPNFDIHEPPPLAMAWNYQAQYDYSSEYRPCIKAEETGEDHTALRTSEINHPVSVSPMMYATASRNQQNRLNASNHAASTQMLRVKTEMSAVSPQESITTPISPNSTTSYLSSQTSSTCNHEHGDSTGAESDYLQRVRKSQATDIPAKYKCDVCSKFFKRGHNLKEHMQSHDPSRPHPHVCEYRDCDKRFVRAADLRRHIDSVSVAVDSIGLYADVQ